MISNVKLYLLIGPMLWMTTLLQAEVRLCPLFNDHMVLQREKPVAVFGTAAPGEKVEVSFQENKVTVAADAQGNWQILLPAMKANPKGEELTISGSNSVIIRDVVVGDVWLCSGQSNMDMNLGGCNRKEDIASADLPGIRSFRTPHATAGSPLRTLKGNPSWIVCNPSSAGGFRPWHFILPGRFTRKTGQRFRLE